MAAKIGTFTVLEMECFPWWLVLVLVLVGNDFSPHFIYLQYSRARPSLAGSVFRSGGA